MASVDAADGALPSAASSPSTSLVGSRYQPVFLSFRGRDTGTGFTDDLYRRLVDRGIPTFGGFEELRKDEGLGPEVLNAIEQSRVFIPIFSNGYASSRWCLMELAKMVESVLSSAEDKTILPIYYDVTRDEVQHQTGVYAEAFSKHDSSGMFTRETVQQWRDALAKVGRIEGWDFNGIRNQGPLIGSVVAQVMSRSKKGRLYSTDGLVGIEDHVEAIMGLLDLEEGNKVIAVGIHGVPGIGKSSLAMAIYNQIWDRFDATSFLHNIREVTKRPGDLARLQGRLISDILGRECECPNGVDYGINVLRNSLRHMKILIILDGVDRTEQLDALVQPDWLPPGSRIIVTMQNRNVLLPEHRWRSEFGLTYYEVMELHAHDALRLFCHRTFHAESPPPGYASLSWKFVKAAGGHPLPIVFMGSSLRGRDTRWWKLYVERHRIVPQRDIYNVLQTAYDSLGGESKQIFLDIACLPVGMDARMASCMWRACGFEPSVGLGNLSRLSLIKIGDDHKMWMTIQLRGLGRDIVRQESTQEPRKRSRLWGEDALECVMYNNRESNVNENVWAICLDYNNGSGEHLITTDSLERLPNLRFLELADANIYTRDHNNSVFPPKEKGKYIATRDSGRLPENLLWLGWHGSTELNIPSRVYPRKLVVLDLSGSAVTESWDGWEPNNEGAEKLEVLNLTSCHQLRKTPHFSSFHHIKMLILQDCSALALVDPSIELLRHLEILDLRKCGNLEELHDNICLLSALEELLLDECPIHKIPISENMKKLRTLSAKSCKLLTQIPESIEFLKQLRELLLDDCESLTELPDSVGRLNSLEVLSLRWTKIDRIPSSFSSSSKLKVLKVDHCPIKSLPCSLGELARIEELSASRCLSLTGEILFELNKLEYLSILRLDHTSISRIPESISGLPRLQTLDLDGCMNLQNLPQLPTSLVNIKITRAASEAIPNLIDLINLRQFEVVNYSSSPVQAQGTNTGHEFEVFLSFRGPDTREGFTDSLYRSLVDAGIRTYRDDEELPKGEEIGPELLEAIQRSRVSIPIFSQGYASSKWCLNELAKMVECMSSAKKQIILPIFYNISPHEVRHQTGTYQKAFKEHVKSRKFSEETIKEWRGALAKVGSLKGWDLTNNRYQGTAIEEVVSEVRQQLKIYLDVPENLVGIEDHMKEVMKLLEPGVDDVRAVGICGMGGIGKTTIAKFIYNRLQDQFHRCSFLNDIRETSSASRGLESLQRHLASDISRRNCDEISHVDGGKHILRGVLSEKKVLILLDGIDKLDQLHNLAGDLDWFGPGSRIIITAREETVLRMSKVFMNAPDKKDSIYNVGPMKSNDALRLFCKHAFRQDFPLPALAGLSEKIVDATGKLPLAIESIGSYLSFQTNDLNVWREACRVLENRKDVLDKLMISYEALGSTNKEIFLDIACLFGGVDSRIPAHVWKHKISAETIIKDLRLRSLITIGDNNEILMHDLYRELGRKIIRDQSNDDLGKQSRLWCSEDAIEVLQSGMGTREVKAINLDCGTFSGEQFNELPNVWFLGLNNANFRGDFQGCLKYLRWLSHHGSDLLNIPRGLHLNNLIVLDLSRSIVNENWEGWYSLKEACSLEVLDLSSCHKLGSTPIFPSRLRIKRLILQDCIKLVEVDHSIKELEALEFLDMRNCTSLVNLPKELGSLASLVELLLDGSSVLEIPLTRNNASLEILSAKSCKSLTELSSSDLPSRLKKLFVDKSSIREIPLMENMANLEVLSAKSCRSLAEISWSIGVQLKLTKLFLDNCESLVVIPDSIGQLQSLTELSLSGTSTIIVPKSIGNLSNLELLNIDHCPISNFPDSLWSLKKLEVITASGCRNLGGNISPQLGDLTRLRILGLDNTNVLSVPSTIGKLHRLHTLNLKGCKKLKALPNLPRSLVNLNMAGMSAAVTVPNLLDLVHLDELEILVHGNNAEVLQYMAKFSKIRKFIITTKGSASPSSCL